MVLHAVGTALHSDGRGGVAGEDDLRGVLNGGVVEDELVDHFLEDELALEVGHYLLGVLLLSEPQVGRAVVEEDAVGGAEHRVHLAVGREEAGERERGGHLEGRPRDQVSVLFEAGLAGGGVVAEASALQEEQPLRGLRVELLIVGRRAAVVADRAFGDGVAELLQHHLCELGLVQARDCPSEEEEDEALVHY